MLMNYMKDVALTEADVLKVKEIKDHRNQIAHELPHFLTGQGYEVKIELFESIRNILHKSNLYWAKIL